MFVYVGNLSGGTFSTILFSWSINSMELNNKRVMTTIYDQVYEVVKENILSGAFEPGQRIQELAIAKELNVSRSPVRSAINKLIGEGLLESTPNKHVWVRNFSKKDILDAYEFRLVIEKYAIEKTIELLDDDISTKLLEFRELILANNTVDHLNEYIQIDSNFHEYLVATSGNKVIAESLEKVSVLINPFRIFSLSSKNRFKESIVEHLGIIDAILEQDGEKALSYCHTHLSLAKEEIIKHLKQQQL